MKKLVFIAFLALGTSVFAQNNKITFTKGQKLEIVTEIQKSSAQEVMGQSMESTMNATITQSLDVEDVNETGATIEQKIKRILLTAEGMGQSQSFDSEKEDDRKGEMGKLMEKSLKNKYTMVIDGAGKLVSVKVDDDNPNANKEDDMSEMMSSQMGFNLGVPKPGDRSEFAILPDKKIAKGDTWTDQENKEGIKRTTNYTVNSITDTEVILDFTEEVSVDKTQAVMGMDAIISTKDKSTGKIIIDKKSGLFKQKNSTTSTEGTVDVQGMSIPVSGKTNLMVTVKPAS